MTMSSAVPAAPDTTRRRAGFIGLGLMGEPMAANVLRAGYPLTVFNRSAAKAEALRAAGAAVAGSPREVGEAAQIVITMLSDAAAVEGVLVGPEGLLQARGPAGRTLIDMSTVSPAQTRRLAALAAEHGWSMLDAPVFGSTGPAREGTLGILVGGARAVFQDRRALLSTMGRHLYYFGPNGSGATAKLCFNLMVAAQVASLAEACALAARGGLDLGMLAEAILASPVASALVERKTSGMVAGDYAPAFPLKHMHKDLGLMIDTAHALGAALPLTAGVHQVFTAAVARGMGEQEFSAVHRLLREWAGLMPEGG